MRRRRGGGAALLSRPLAPSAATTIRPPTASTTSTSSTTPRGPLPHGRRALIPQAPQAPAAPLPGERRSLLSCLDLVPVRDEEAPRRELLRDDLEDDLRPEDDEDAEVERLDERDARRVRLAVHHVLVHLRVATRHIFTPAAPTGTMPPTTGQAWGKQHTRLQWRGEHTKRMMTPKNEQHEMRHQTRATDGARHPRGHTLLVWFCSVLFWFCLFDPRL